MASGYLEMFRKVTLSQVVKSDLVPAGGQRRKNIPGGGNNRGKGWVDRRHSFHRR